MTFGIAFPFEGDSLLLDPYFSRLLEGFSGAAAEAGYGFLLIPQSPERSGFPLRELLREHRFDGAIVADPLEGDRLIPLLRRNRVPVVTTGRYGEGGLVPWVDNDNRRGMELLLDHLFQTGYERPALISMKAAFSYSFDIESAYRQRMRGAAGAIVKAGTSEDAGYRSALRLLGRLNPPDAIIASGDRQALGVLRAAHDLGIRVPSELGVAGSGDTIARHARPQLTSIKVQAQALGVAAVHSLQSLVNDGIKPPDQVLPVSLVARGSTRRSRTRRDVRES
jgi:DNA-binding LacI/PurR family transcriptional regulator